MTFNFFFLDGVVFSFVGVTVQNEVITSCGHIWRGHAQTHSLIHGRLENIARQRGGGKK